MVACDSRPLGRGAPGNPFSSMRVQPGAMPYLFEQGWTRDRLIQRLVELGMSGQIVGPHGSGKSTLLAHLAEGLRSAGYRTVESEPQDLNPSVLPPGFVLVLDSAERLGFLGLARLKRRVSAIKGGLVITAHADAGLPMLCSTQCTLNNARRVIACVLEGATVGLPDDALIQRLLSRHAGNLRLVLFDLYDWYEDRHRRREGQSEW